MDPVRDKAHENALSLENPPKNVVMPIEFSRATIGEMRERAGARLNGLPDSLCARIGVAEAHANPKLNSALDGGNGALTFGSDRQENWIVATRVPKLVNMCRRWVAHNARVVGATISGALGQKGTFDMPADNGLLKLLGFRAQFPITP